MSEKEPPKAPEGRFQLGLHSFFKPPPPLTVEQQKEKQDAAAAKHKQLAEQQRADARPCCHELGMSFDMQLEAVIFMSA